MSADGYCPFDSSVDGRSVGLEPKSFIDPEFGRISYWTTATSKHDKSGYSLLLLHGVGGTWSSWIPLLRAMGDIDALTMPVLALDLPGYGGSSNDIRSLSVHDVADMIDRLLGSLSIRKAHIVGQSMGGFLALSLAAREETRVQYSATAFSGTLFYMSELARGRIRPLLPTGNESRDAVIFRTFKALGVAVRAIAWFSARTGLMRRGLSKTAAHPDLVPASFLRSVAKGIRPECFLLAARNGIDYDPFTSWGSIGQNAVAVFGDTDSVVGPREQRIMRERLSNVKTVTVSDCGHYAPFERPYEAAQIIAESIGRHGR